MSWVLRDIKRLVGDQGLDWTVIWACLICWLIYATPLALAIMLERALPTHWVPA